MEIYKHMMTDKDGHWWDKEMTAGWYIRKSKGQWLGILVWEGLKKGICKRTTRSKALKEVVAALTTEWKETR